MSSRRGSSDWPQSPLAAQVRDAGAQQRVGEQAHAVQFDQRGGVAHENDTVRGRRRARSRSRYIGHALNLPMR